MVDVKASAPIAGISVCLAGYWSGVVLLGGIFLSIALAATNLLGIPAGAVGLVIIAFGLSKTLFHGRLAVIASLETIAWTLGRLL